MRLSSGLLRRTSLPGARTIKETDMVNPMRVFRPLLGAVAASALLVPRRRVR